MPSVSVFVAPFITRRSLGLKAHRWPFKLPVCASGLGTKKREKNLNVSVASGIVRNVGRRPRMLRKARGVGSAGRSRVEEEVDFGK